MFTQVYATLPNGSVHRPHVSGHMLLNAGKTSQIQGLIPSQFLVSSHEHNPQLRGHDSLMVGNLEQDIADFDISLQKYWSRHKLSKTSKQCNLASYKNARVLIKSVIF